MNRGNNKGFSLVEAMVSIAIASMLLLMAYTAHRSIMLSIKDMSQIAEFYQGVNLVMNRINGDISTALFISNNAKTFLVGSNDMGSRNNAKLSLVTVNRFDYNFSNNLKSETHTSDIKEVSYFLKPDPAYPDLFLLVRREANQYDDKPFEGGTETVILDNVLDLTFEFTVRSSWDKKWDSRDSKRFPQAIKTTLKLRNYRGTEEEFTLISYLYLVKP